MELAGLCALRRSAIDKQPNTSNGTHVGGICRVSGIVGGARCEVIGGCAERAAEFAVSSF